MANDELLTVGTLLAERYEIVKRLGKGGMGNVYLAHDKRLSDAPRAVKEMIVEFVDQDQYAKAVDNFRREAHVLASLDHPSIPTIYDYFVAKGYYYLVMKCVKGKDLEQLLDEAPEGRLPEKLVTQWSIQLCDVLKYIHNQDPPIIYRDLKPPNVMYDEQADRIVLIDFGIARFVTSGANVTAIGTMGYAPPELFMGKVVPASDIFSLGATMFHLLTGADPQLNPILGFDFNKNPPPREINPDLTDAMEQIIMKAVALKPAERFSSAAELKSVLEDHLYYLNHTKAATHANTANAQLVIVHSKSEKTAAFPLKPGSMLVGRFDVDRGLAPDIDLSSFDTSGKISRRHALIFWEGGDYHFEDLGSSNGSLHNGERVPAQQRLRLKPGDQLCIGEIVLEFSLS
ncbi:MAG: FHA domain-containing serine/threonine-protein kinase [Acidobacteriota bacterium]